MVGEYRATLSDRKMAHTKHSGWCAMRTVCAYVTCRTLRLMIRVQGISWGWPILRCIAQRLSADRLPPYYQTDTRRRRQRNAHRSRSFDTSRWAPLCPTWSTEEFWKWWSLAGKVVGETKTRWSTSIRRPIWELRRALGEGLFSTEKTPKLVGSVRNKIQSSCERLEIIEEAPAPGLSPALKRDFAEKAVAAAKAIN